MCYVEDPELHGLFHHRLEAYLSAHSPELAFWQCFNGIDIHLLTREDKSALNHLTGWNLLQVQQFLKTLP